MSSHKSSEEQPQCLPGSEANTAEGNPATDELNTFYHPQSSNLELTAEPDPDLGRIGPGHVCKHGVRWPHACNECDAAAFALTAEKEGEGDE